MNTTYLRSRFEDHLVTSRMKFSKDVRIHGSRVDYVLEVDDQFQGVIIRGSRANLHSTIGNLVNIKRTFSHVYLLAPPKTIEKVDKVLRETGVLQTVGFLTIGNEGPVYLKKTQPKSYYFNKPIEIKTKKTFKARHMVLNDVDKKIIEHFRETTITVAEISKTLGISMPNAYRRVLRLKKAKLLEEISEPSTYPKVFKVPENIEIKETITLDA